ncbi:hypothetical protein ACQQ2N_00110 [Dokdonella sp. MW10]|uniref:hypothetical protein n=1 Tax=Dokdonella sp. MW10 TaxID=2992926 RepID=UPI003F801165
MHPADPRRAAAATVGSAVALAGVVLIAYANAFDAAFQFDDFAVIVDNPAVHDLAAWWASMPGIRPLLKLSYALGARADMPAWPFHATNIALHMLNAVLAWRLVLHWQSRLAPTAPAFCALMAAFLFALHPAATEAVTYVSGRSIALSSTFVLAALIAHARADARGDRVAWIAALWFALALGVRETSIVVPFAVLALAACDPTTRWRTTLQRMSAHAVVLVAAACATAAMAGYQRFFGVSLSTRSLADQLLGQLHAHAYLVTGPLLTLRTNIDPPLEVPASFDAASLVIAVAMIAVAALAIAMRRRAPWITYALAWYAVMLAPSNSLLPRLDWANDRHLYLAMLGPAWLLALGLSRLPRRFATVVAAVLGATLALATHQRNDEYASEVALWQASLADAPRNARAWTNLGDAWRREGDVARARDAALCALAFDAQYTQAVLNLDALPGADLRERRSRDECLVIAAHTAR